MHNKVVLVFLSMILTGSAMASTLKNIFGYAEKATLTQQDLTLPAKLDTGAKSASLNAIKIKKIEKDGKAYLTFIVPSRTGDIPFECEYVGDVKIKIRSAEKKAGQIQKESIKRPTVMMKVKLNGKERDIRVNLTNRKNFIYPILLGREAIIAFDGIIDPSKKFTIKNN